MRRNLSSRTLVIMFSHSYVNIGRASTLQSLLLLVARTTYIMVLFFMHIPFVVNHTINATPPERLQQYQGCGVKSKMSKSNSELSKISDTNSNLCEIFES